MCCEKRTEGSVHRFGIGEMFFNIGIKHYCTILFRKILYINGSILLFNLNSISLSV